VLGVVAVLHVGAGEFAEANGHFHFTRGVGVRADAVDVLACPFFPLWRCLAFTAEDHAFLEVHMHRVAPAVAAVLDLPHFQGTVAAEAALGRFAGQLWRRRDAPRVHAVAETAVGLDGPGASIGAVGAPKDELAVAGRLELGLIGGSSAVDGQRDHLQAFGLARLGRFVGARVHADVLAAVGLHDQLHDLAHHRVTVFPLRAATGLLDHGLVLLGQHVGQRDGLFRTLAGFMLHDVDDVQLVAGLDPVLGEVDDDVVALGDALQRQDGVVVVGLAVAVEVHGAVERHGVFHDVAVVGDHVERHPGVRHVGAGRALELATVAGDFTHHGELEVARHRTVEDTEAVAAGADLELGLVLPVDQHLVTEEAIGVERVEPQLAVLIPGLVGDHQVDVVVAVAPGHPRTAGEAQVDPVLQRFVAAVDGAVVVHHHSVAFVDVLRREIHHVVVEPVGTHGLMPVATNLDAAVLAGLEPRVGVVDEQGFTRRAGERGARVFGTGVDGVVTGQLDRPAVVIVLAREEVRVGKAIALGRRVTVVLVGGNGVQAKACVGCRVDRQRVVVAHQHRLAITNHQQFRREGAVEGPQRLVVLQREVRVEAGVDALGGAKCSGDVRGLVIQPARRKFPHGIVVQLLAVAQPLVDACACLCGLERSLGVELVPALVRPAFSWWPAFCRRADRITVKEHLDLRFPRVAVQGVGVLGRVWVQARLLEEGFQGIAVGAAASDHVRVLRRFRAECGNREGQRWWRQVGVEFFRTEFFEQQQLLGERLRTEQRARLAVGWVIARRLQGRRQHVVDAIAGPVTVNPILQFQRTLVGFRQVGQVQQRGRGVSRLVIVVRRVCRRRLADIVQRRGHG